MKARIWVGVPSLLGSGCNSKSEWKSSDLTVAVWVLMSYKRSMTGKYRRNQLTLGFARTVTIVSVVQISLALTISISPS